MHLSTRLRAFMRAHPFATACAVLLSCAPIAAAQAPGSGDRPLTGSAVPLLEQFLRAQAAGLPGEVRIRLVQPQSGPLPDCGEAAGTDAPAPPLEAFLPPGTRPWGRVSVGVRCTAHPAWTRYVAAHIAVHGAYYVAARPIAAGQGVSLADVERREGDLTALPASVVVDAAQIEGRLALNPVASGMPIRAELLRSPARVMQGQQVKLVQRGTGFMAMAEGKALTTAPVGGTVQVRVGSGQVLSGVVQPDGTVARGP